MHAMVRAKIRDSSSRMLQTTAGDKRMRRISTLLYRLAKEVPICRVTAAMNSICASVAASADWLTSIWVSVAAAADWVTPICASVAAVAGQRELHSQCRPTSIQQAQ
jgi:hypothetical protein